MPSEDTEVTVPDGWVREEIVAGMGTVRRGEYHEVGGGYKCDRCDHFVPLEALEEPTCPSCGRGGMIGAVIMGQQDVTLLRPAGWFDGGED